MKGAKILKEIQLNNFRSLKDTGLQTLSPITLLVGENSSGKSSFLRAFPLLKQSINKRTSGPILWSGDIDDYVDFGSFDETVTNDKSTSMDFRFRFHAAGLDNIFAPFIDDDNDETDFVDFKITVSSENGRDFVSNFCLSLNSFDFKFNLKENTVFVDDALEYVVTKEKTNDDLTQQHHFLSSKFTDSKCKSFGFSLPNIIALWEEIFDMFDNQEKTTEDFRWFNIYQVVLNLGRRLINKENIQTISKMMDDSEENEITETYIFVYNSLVEKAASNVRLSAIIKLLYLYLIFPNVDTYIKDYFKNVHYIAPLRATAERYYRLRNLAVDEVDYQGKNLAVFINSLTNKQIKDFNSWTMEHFGFAVSTDKSKGHLSLLIKLKNSKKAINLSDTGFGYSQVLPIITQLWDLSSRSTSRKNNKDADFLLPLVVAIEQPELHLHPAVQAKLTKAFIASIKLAQKHGYQLQLLLETHSETIVNYLGKAISKGEITPEEVSIILFEKKDNESVTTVKKSCYDKDGYLKDWPYGFFYAGE